MPAVSVIMLAWNAGEHLRPAVASILGQTMADLELVLVDNGSQDGSVDRLVAAGLDARIRLLRQPRNLGLAEGFHAAFPHCTAPWLAVMDSDDIAHPMRLELQLKAAAVDPALAAVATGGEAIDGDGKSLGPFPSYYTADDISRYAPFGMPVAHPTLLVRAETFRRVGYRAAIEFASDYDFVLRALEQGAKFGAVSLPLYSYRRHPGSITQTRTASFEGGASAVRLFAARRRAGRPERLEETMADVRRLVAAGAPLAAIYTHVAGECRREGFALLAALHAALAVRARPSAPNVARFLGHLLAAMRQDRGSFGEALSGGIKGPFWVLLRRAGFPGVPRY